MSKRRLLKDLPFEDLKKGTVLTKNGSSYIVKGGVCFFECGGSSDNATKTFSDTSQVDIIDTIWNNGNWFECLNFDSIDIRAYNNSILIEFDNLDLEDSQLFMKGVIACLEEYKKVSVGKSYDKFGGFSISIKNPHSKKRGGR